MVQAHQLVSKRISSFLLKQITVALARCIAGMAASRNCPQLEPGYWTDQCSDLVKQILLSKAPWQTMEHEEFAVPFYSAAEQTL